MAKINSIIKSNEKKVGISDYLPAEIREEGKEDFVTIKKLSFSDKKKIEFISMNNLSGKTGKALFDYAKKKGLKYENLQKLSKEDQFDIVSTIMTGEDGKAIVNNAVELSSVIINCGIDPDNHSFIDDNNEKIKLNFEILSSLGNDYLIDYLVEEIKTFSQGFILGEQKRTV